MIYLYAVLIIGLLVLIHEGGHFIAARCMGLPVARFSVGYGPALWKFNRRGVEYRLSVVPWGGYLLLGLEKPLDYLELPLGKRLIFSLAGPLANIITAVLLFALFNVLVDGFSLAGVLTMPFTMTWDMLLEILKGYSVMFSQPENTSGVVGIVAEGGRFMDRGLLYGLYFHAFVSLNLALFNLLPIPPLDGGKMCLDLVHSMKPSLSGLYVKVSLAGGAVFLLMMSYTTIMDVVKYSS